MLDEALWWLNKGISVVPQVYGTKVPSVKWKNYTYRKPPLRLVERWFLGKRNLGIIPKGDLYVFDFDIPYEYVKWRQKHKKLSETMTVRTKRGWHVYLKVKDLIEDEVNGFIWPLGDIKSQMTVTVPPSNVNGWEYHYLNGREIAEVRDLDEAGIEVVDRVDFDIFPRGGGQEGRYDKCGPYEQGIINFLSSLTTLRARSDGTMIGVCPFHEDRKPSLQVWPEEGRFYCHSNRCVAHKRCDIHDAMEMRTI